MQVVLFDFWGTLVELGEWSPTKQVRRYLGVRMEFGEFVQRMQRVMMLKSYPSLREMFIAVCEEFGVEANDHRLDQLVGMWNKSWMLAEPYQDTLAVLKELSETHKLVLIANTDTVSVPNVLEKFSLKEHFSDIFLSCEIGYLKSDAAFYDHVIETIGAQRENVVVVGDSLASDIEPAQRAGLKAILIDRRDKRDFSPKVLSLKDVKTLL